jgi:hypothetical protein
MIAMPGAVALAGCGHSGTGPRQSVTTVTPAQTAPANEGTTVNTRSSNPVFRRKLSGFIACLHRHGVRASISHTRVGPEVEPNKTKQSGARSEAAWRRCRDTIGGTLFHSPLRERRSTVRGSVP